jgi:hypothetical protein
MLATIRGNSFTSLFFMDEHHELNKFSSRPLLHRYQHEPFTSNFLRRDIPPFCILFVFVFLVVLIFSQIIIIHSLHYGSNAYAMHKMREELRQMDETMVKLIRSSSLPVEQWRVLFRVQCYFKRFRQLFEQVDRPMNETQHRTIFDKHVNALPNPSNGSLVDDGTSRSSSSKALPISQRTDYCHNVPQQLSK